MLALENMQARFLSTLYTRQLGTASIRNELAQTVKVNTFWSIPDGCF